MEPTATAPINTDSTKCHLLDAPAEIRNTIYDLVFATDGDGTEIELPEAIPPSNGLLFACRKTYNEAKLVYGEAYRHFWRDTKFVLTLRPPQPNEHREWDEYFRHKQQEINGLEDRVINEINYLRITDGYFDWKLDERVWFEGGAGVTPRFVILPDTYRAASMELRYSPGTYGPSWLALSIRGATVTPADLEAVKEIVKGRQITVEEIVMFVTVGKDIWSLE